MKFKAILLLLFSSLWLIACSGPAEPAEPPTPQPLAEAGEAPLASGETVTLGEGSDETHTFVVVTAESEARYVVNEEFFADALRKYGIEPGQVVVTGVTPEVTGELQINFGQSDLLEAATFTVNMSRLSTDQSSRDEWLQDNAIQTNAFPNATFVATSISNMPASYTEGEEINFQLNGDLTVRDTTNPVTFEVTAVLTGSTIRGSAVRQMQMTDFGITPPDFANTLTVANDFRIEINLTAIKQ